MNERKIMLVTGASSEIGLRIVEYYAQKNYELIAHYNLSDKCLNEIKDKYSAKNIHLFKADLSKEEEIYRLNNFINEGFGRVDCFVHLPAPKVLMRRNKDLKWQNFQNHLDVQVKSAHIILSEFLPGMAKRKDGNIVFILSSCVFGLPPGAMTDYVVAKYALLGYMKCLVKEFSSKSIKINAISPSMIETKFIENLPEVVRGLNRENHPLKRLASVEDVFSSLKFLISESSPYLTGSNIPLTGGEVC
ncbi:MAG: SDR family oxidoreductase [Bacteriovorax sp.]|nr:SDR family oxidoreductase [Bacteriovorax sp.]